MKEASEQKIALLGNIESIINDKYRSDKKPILLSQLGEILKLKSNDYLDLIAPLKLRIFIEQNLHEKVDVMVHPKQSQKIALLPKGHEFSFETVTSHQELPSANKKADERIKPTLWAAFVKPLPASSHRYIDIRDSSFRFTDFKNEVTNNRTSLREVPAAMIIDGKGPNYRPEKVVENIINWSMKNNISLDTIYIRNDLQNNYKNLFAEFRNLSEEDLKRVNIPFDVILKILNR
nr:hypothetical protein [Brucella intermedia]